MRKGKKLLKIVIILLVVGLLFCIGLYIYAKVMPKLSIKSANSFYLYDKSAELFSGNPNQDWVSIKDISDDLIKATISVEDKNFYKHPGFDIPRIMKAMLVNIKDGKKSQGASTISQQYAKNLFLDFGKTWKRKMEEALLTIRLEVHYSKDQILEGYLNTINYGGIFGIENAAHYYFNKSAKELSLAESTILAGIPKYPAKYSPLVNEKVAKKRQKLILEAMKKNKYITQKEMDDAYKEKLTYVGSFEKNDLQSLMYYEDAVIEELKSIKTIPSSFLTTGGLKIYTTLDRNVQKNMEESIDKNINEQSEIEAASIAVEPSTGKILALTGGKSYSKSQFNRATTAKRQMGSTLKPFLYYSALENGFTASTTFRSAKTTFSLGEGKTYSPSNYGNIYAGKDISLAAALAYSDNIFAVKTHLFLGEDSLVDIGKRTGISNSLKPIPSLALGTEELTLKQMMQGYQVLANEGTKENLFMITKVEDINGNVLYEHKKEENNVLNKSTTFILSNLLSNCYAKELIDYTVPTCMVIAPKLSKTYAIKTGTTNTDHLIFGYNKDLVVGVWSGYDDNRKTVANDGTNSKQIWADLIEGSLKDKEDAWYKMPSNVAGVLVDPVSGKVATNETTKKKLLYYIKGTEPYNKENKNSKLDSLVPNFKTEE
ncbi:MAG: PBP1A family penicillin-binding protein [Bacilli bacterium]|nr:PBP1A family penicillin-binding protein [Bacilli bacterium]